MHDIEGLTLREISEAVGRPLQTIASQLRAGRKQLADWMHTHHADLGAEMGSAPHRKLEKP